MMNEFSEWEKAAEALGFKVACVRSASELSGPKLNEPEGSVVDLADHESDMKDKSDDE